MAKLTLESGAKDLVVRSRNGDQNAMAMIAEVRKAAQRGSVKARMGFEAIKQYIEKNPTAENAETRKWDRTIPSDAQKTLRDLRDAVKGQIGSASRMGAEGSDPELTCRILLALPKTGGERTLNAGTVALANGPKLTDARIRQIGSGFGDEALRELFYKHIVRFHPSMADEVAEQLQPIVGAGQIVGQARALQVARLPNSPLSMVSPQTGWELGYTQ